MMIKMTNVLVPVLLLAATACSGAKSEQAAAVPRQAAATLGEPSTLSVGRSARYPDGLEVRLETIDDSRCPPDKVCVWEGELAPLLRLRGGSLSKDEEVRLGTSRTAKATAGGYTIALQEATPSTATIIVTEGGAPEDTTDAACRKTGCSGEICSDRDIASTCIYRPEYDCYKSATCERQADGRCGFTETPALTECLAAAGGD
jgi:eight-cysteine-cluster-containing protein